MTRAEAAAAATLCGHTGPSVFVVMCISSSEGKKEGGEFKLVGVHDSSQGPKTLGNSHGYSSCFRMSHG